ncbi:MAG: translation elongation factor Ts [Brevinematia bacterium]
MEITAAMIKELKEKTGAGIVDCKSVLQETGGDINKAIEILRKKGLSKADKKAGREAKEGISTYVVEGKKGLVLKVNCETDFVAKTDDFKNFVEEVKKIIFTKGYDFSTTLPSELEELRRNVIAKVGENILISEWKFINAKAKLFPYVHLNKVAVILDYDTSVENEAASQIIKNIAMQITAMNPIAITAEGIPAKQLEEVKSQFTEEARQTGKPEKVIENIVKGKLEKYYADVVLLEQAFILDEEKKVKAVIEDFEKSNGVKINLYNFVRVSL